MKIGVFNTKDHDVFYLDQANQTFGFTLEYQQARLNNRNIALAEGCSVVSIFVNDKLDAQAVKQLSTLGIRHIALRCAGFNNVDLEAAREHHIAVSRVPAYSPAAVAEHTVALMLCINRRIHKAHNRVRENNFSLEGLMGFNLQGKTAGIVGYGQIGKQVAQILTGFGCEVVVYDPKQPQIQQPHPLFVSFERLLEISHIISLHCPLTQQNQHMIDEDAIARMKHNVMLINTSRGALLDTRAIIAGLKKRKIGYLGLDVYELESELFFEDLSCQIIEDDVFERLSTFPNVLITAHQGFYTHEALTQIAGKTMQNIALANQMASDDNSFLVAPQG